MGDPSGSVADQTRDILAALEEILAENGSDKEHMLSAARALPCGVFDGAARLFLNGGDQGDLHFVSGAYQRGLAADTGRLEAGDDPGIPHLIGAGTLLMVL